MIVFHSGHISKYGPEVTMAAKKKILRSSKELRLEQCDGTDCGNGWCCNNPSYSLCCPACEDGTQYCAGDDDDCPDCTVMNIHNMAAEKRWKMKDVGVCKSSKYCSRKLFNSILHILSMSIF